MVHTPDATVAPPDHRMIGDDRAFRVVEPAGEGDGSPAVSLAAISKVFGTRADATPALDRVSLDVAQHTPTDWGVTWSIHRMRRSNHHT